MRIVFFFVIFILPFGFLYAQTNDLLFEDLTEEFEELDIDDYSDRDIDSEDIEDAEDFGDDLETVNDSIADDVEVVDVVEDGVVEDSVVEDSVVEDTESGSVEVNEEEETGYERYLDDSEWLEEDTDAGNEVEYEEEIEDEVRDLASDEELTLEPSEDIYDEDAGIDNAEETFEVEYEDDGLESDPDAYDIETGYADDPYNEEETVYDEYGEDTFADESVNEENIIDDIVSESILEEDDPRREEGSRNIASEEDYLEEEFADIREDEGDEGEIDYEGGEGYGYEDEGGYDDDGYGDGTYREIASDGLNAPDLELEAYLDDIFSKYSDRLDQVKWEEMIGSERVKEVYAIQPGDTLWDISTTLFGSGYFWPKIWQINSVILNPHFILSGGQIRFTSGSVDEAPRLDLVTGEAEEDGVLSSTSLIPDLPPAQETRFSNLPPSLPGMNINPPDPQEYREPSSLSLSANDFSRVISNAPIYIASYLTTRKPQSFGTIVSAEEWNTVASTYQHVYIEGRGLSIGSNYVVFNDDRRVGHPTRGSNAGFLVSILGVVNIVEAVRGKNNLFRAKVVKAITPISVGSYIREDSPTLRYNLSKTDQSGNFEAMVVSGYEGDNRVFVGVNEILFLDMGSSHGVRLGDMFKIIASGNRKKQLSKKIVGIAKVVKTDEKRSTAVVLDANDVISPGDYTEPL